MGYPYNYMDAIYMQNVMFNGGILLYKRILVQPLDNNNTYDVRTHRYKLICILIHTCMCVHVRYSVVKFISQCFANVYLCV